MNAKTAKKTIGKLLIVDDEAELMTALCEMIAAHGFDTRGFTTGEEALETLKKEDIDLVLTDLMMPGMDGIALLKEGLKVDPNLVGIVMTGQATVKTAVEAMKMGAVDYVMKPFKLRDVLAAITRAMEIRRLRIDNIQLRETIALHELAKTITYPLDMRYIIDKMADAVLQQCRADEVSIMLPENGDNGKLYVAAARGEHAQYILGTRVPMEEGIAGWVARNRQPVTLYGNVDDKRFKPAYPRHNIISAISIPMVSGGKTVGVLNLNITKGNRRFTLGEIKALDILIGLVSPVLESSWLYKKVKDTEEQYRLIFENALEGIYQTSADDRIIAANPSFIHMLGYESYEDLTASVTDLRHQFYADPERYDEFRRLIEELGEIRGFEYQACRRDGSRIWVSDNARVVHNNGLYYEGFIEDITKRKLEEKRQELAVLILELLNRQDDIKSLIHSILVLLKKETDIEAIGIRLREGDDYPYYEVNGLPEHFVSSGSSLCARDDKGQILRDPQGNPVLECLCGNILSGLTDPSQPFFTEKGSFWTNSVSKLPASISGKNGKTRMRNRCSSEGYESMALIPLRSGDGIIGLLQFNDPRPGCFTIERIHFLEGIGASIGIAISRHLAERERRESEERYHVAIESANDAVVISDEHTHIFVNRKFLKMFGYDRSEEAIIKTRFDFVHPDDKKMVIDYAQKRVRGEPVPERYEFKGLRKDGAEIYVEASAALITYAGRKCSLVYFRDVTDRKNAEKELQNTLDKLRTTLSATVQAMAVTVEARDPYTAGHQRRVADLVRAIAQEMNLPQDVIDGVVVAGLIHDIGKISIPAEILVKPTRLTEMEFNIIKIHPESGYNILKEIEFPWQIADIVLQHHEKLDGSGYPRALKNGQILFEAKILTVADVVEAMASHRPYRPSLGIDVALREIEANKGTLYDAGVVDTCLRLFNEKGYKLE